MQNSPIPVTIGRIVLFVPLAGSAAANDVDVAPAVVVRVNDHEDCQSANLTVLTNHPENLWYTEVPYSENKEPGTWHWPEPFESLSERHAKTTQLSIASLLSEMTQPNEPLASKEDWILDDVKDELATTEAREVAVFTGFVEWLRGEERSNVEGMIDLIDEYLESRWGGSAAQTGPVPEVTDPAVPQESATGQVMEPITGTGQDDAPTETPAEPTPETPKEEPEAKAKKGSK